LSWLVDCRISFSSVSTAQRGEGNRALARQTASIDFYLQYCTSHRSFAPRPTAKPRGATCDILFVILLNLPPAQDAHQARLLSSGSCLYLVASREVRRSLLPGFPCSSCHSSSSIVTVARCLEDPPQDSQNSSGGAQLNVRVACLCNEATHC